MLFALGLAHGQFGTLEGPVRIAHAAFHPLEPVFEGAHFIFGGSTPRLNFLELGFGFLSLGLVEAGFLFRKIEALLQLVEPLLQQAGLLLMKLQVVLQAGHLGQVAAGAAIFGRFQLRLKLLNLIEQAVLLFGLVGALLPEGLQRFAQQFDFGPLVASLF